MKQLASDAAVVAAALSFLYFMCLPSLQPATDPDESEAVTIRMELLTVFATQILVDFAKTHQFESHAELMKLIESAGLSREWLAVHTRQHNSDGTSVMVPRAYRPSERPWDFEAIHAAFAALAGNAPRPGQFDLSRVEIVMLERTLMEKEPEEGLNLLLHP